MPFKDEYIYWKSETLMWRHQHNACRGCYFLDEPPLYECKGGIFRQKFSCVKYGCISDTRHTGIFTKYDDFI